MKKKKIKIKYKNVFAFLFFLILLFLGIYYILHLKITNIYITNTDYLKDRYILEKAGLMEKPTIIQSFFMNIEKKLEKDVYIKKVTMNRKSIFDIHLKIEENKPLFYHNTLKKTILEDGSEVKEIYSVPKLLNYIPDKKYKKFIKKMASIDKNILEQISEIKYEPNDKDDGRFLLSMVDGNYVYVTINKINMMNSYMDIMLEMQRKFENKHGILYLDSGKYFKVLEN